MLITANGEYLCARVVLVASEVAELTVQPQWLSRKLKRPGKSSFASEYFQKNSNDQAELKHRSIGPGSLTGMASRNQYRATGTDQPGNRKERVTNGGDELPLSDLTVIGMNLPKVLFGHDGEAFASFGVIVRQHLEGQFVAPLVI